MAPSLFKSKSHLQNKLHVNYRVKWKHLIHTGKCNLDCTVNENSQLSPRVVWSPEKNKYTYIQQDYGKTTAFTMQWKSRSVSWPSSTRMTCNLVRFLPEIDYFKQSATTKSYYPRCKTHDTMVVGWMLNRVGSYWQEQNAIFEKIKQSNNVDGY